MAVLKRMEKKFYDVREAEAETGVSAWTWRSWAYSGRCASVKLGSSKQARLLIPAAEIERLMNEGLRPALR